MAWWPPNSTGFTIPSPQPLSTVHMQPLQKDDTLMTVLSWVQGPCNLYNMLGSPCQLLATPTAHFAKAKLFVNSLGQLAKQPAKRLR